MEKMKINFVGQSSVLLGTAPLLSRQRGAHCASTITASGEREIVPLQDDFSRLSLANNRWTEKLILELLGKACTVAPETGFTKHTLIRISAPLFLPHALPFPVKGNARSSFINVFRHLAVTYSALLAHFLFCACIPVACYPHDPPDQGYSDIRNTTHTSKNT
jgi:hypothetical protein